MQRRLGIAQAVLGEPPLIVFDEPTVGLDPEERKRFKDLLFELKNKSTILFSSHIVGDLEEVCENIIIMDKGTIIETGTLPEICQKNSDDGNLETAYLNIVAARKAQKA